MGTRRRSRVLAMQALFDMDISQDISEERLEHFYNHFSPSKKTLPFFVKLTKGVIKYRAEIDTLIERYSSNWKISRMSCVDRNIMRVAIYEMLYCQDIPVKVSINEAIDVAKKFGNEESGAFINGILDSINNSIKKDNTD